MAAILGYGAVSSLGYGVGRIWSALAEGRDGITPVRRFDAKHFGIPLGAIVPDHADAIEPGAALCVEMSIAAAREAWQRASTHVPAGLDSVPRERVALVFGTSLGDMGMRVHDMAAAIGDELDVRGPRLVVSTACASSTNALGMALDLLALDSADIVIAGGADVLTELVFAGFAALGVMSSEKCAPFSEPPGTTLGEGAGFVVLGRDQASALALLGYGISTDAFHDTSPDPTGAGVARAMRGALAHAGVTADDVDYVNAHGTGTKANDPAEWRAIQQALGARATAVPVSSSKSFLGHGQGAAGVLETIATLVAMEQGMIPPTQRFQGARANVPPDVVGQATARCADVDVAVKASAAFGGANCSIVIGRARTSPEITRRHVWLSGLATVTAPCDLAAIAPAVDPRGLDPSTRYLVAAVSLALADAKLKLRGDAKDRTGMIIGLLEASTESDRALDATIAEHGFRGLSANLFARQVLNAAPGTCARLLGIRGMHSVVSAGGAGGLAAFVYAAELLATRRDCDALVTGGLDEGADLASHGAACALVTAQRTDVRIASWHVAGVGRLAVDAGDVDRVLDAATTDAFASAREVVRAAQLVRAGEARRILIRQSAPGCADCALVLEGDTP